MRLGLILIIVALIAAFFLFGVDNYFSLSNLQQQHTALTAFVSAHPLRAASIYFFVYVAMAGLSLPGATLVTLLGGALFGVVWGTILVSFASTVGASVAFLFARYVFRDYIDDRFGPKLRTLNDGIEKEGPFYLFTIRLIPVIPYFVVNLLMGLTHIRLWIFFIVSQLGMLPATLVYVNAGTQLGKLTSLSDILSPALILSFAALGLFPLVAKKVIEWRRLRAALKPFTKPQTFDRNLVVIGAGSGGLVSAYIAAAIEAEVSLIERAKMGGDCLNYGCVPSKALIRAAKAVHTARNAHRFGVDVENIHIDFERAMAHVHHAIEQIAPHDSVERYTELGVDCIQGEAKLIDPYHVEVNGKRLSTRNIILATGGEPFVPKIDGLDAISYLTSDNVWTLKTLPNKLVIVGGGPIGCELSQAFARLGSQVTIIQRGPRLMPREDSDVSDFIATRFVEEGIDVKCDTNAEAIKLINDKKYLIGLSNTDHKETQFEFDEILFAVGRTARTNVAGLQTLGIELRANGTIKTDRYLRTNIPTIYACGDATGPFQFTHVASHQAWYAAVNALFAGWRKFAVDYRVIPWCTFTDPEVARVGLSEKEATEQKIPFEVTRYGIDDLDRAITDGSNYGFVKVLTVPGKDRILGATIVGEHAGDLLSEFVLAMRHQLGLNKILGTIHTYPTLSEANKFAAGNWRRAHKPAWAMNLLRRFHQFRRS